ncbi:MAG: phosphate signaling complex protein PhoU [Propionibacterium sp.]|nr:phosphate signaling complex protein PhoU [Propionibacterium sp.]
MFEDETQGVKPVRVTYREQLQEVVDDLISMAESARHALRFATRALLEVDLQLSEQVISDDVRLDEIHDDLERRCFMLLARQAPVAGELRTVVATLRMLTSLARMGDLSAHVAKIARLRYPEPAVPKPMQPNFARMAEVAEQMIVCATEALRTSDVSAAQELAAQDTEMDTLRRTQFRILLGEDWSHGVEAAVDVALLGRYYERIADHTVAISRQVIYVVTGESPDGEDWPRF